MLLCSSARRVNALPFLALSRFCPVRRVRSSARLSRSLHLGSRPPTIPGIPPERRAIHQQSAQEVGIWAGRGWRALRLVQQSVTLRKVTVESSACVAGAKAAFDGQSREEPRSQGGSRSMVLFPGGALQNEAEVSDARISFVRRGSSKLHRLDAT